MTLTRPRVWAVRAALLLLAFTTLAGRLRADPAAPPKPPLYFNDNAHVVDAATAADLNEQLAQFERDTSSQIVVAIYPSLPAGAEAAQYATQTYNAWGIGQKTRNNGAVLFVFVNDHKLFIATGRGLEGALPDITCEEIIRQEIVPAFKQNDYAGGLRAGVAAMMAAAKGEYKGNGQTHAEQNQPADNGFDLSPGWIFFAFILLMILSRALFPAFLASPYIFSGGGYGSGFGGGWGGGGGGFGGGGGGFSGGGGSSAGGGAGGSW